ncbi:MAG: potassium channel family protein [Actinobacteria bacterium]|nr:potassium channel family protein [Actinomycetota bacterium]
MKRSQARFDRLASLVELPMTILAIIWLICYLIPIFFHIGQGAKDSLLVLDLAIWAAFIIEYLAKCFVAPQLWQFIRRNLLDLLLIAIPILRPFRAVRALRFLPLGRTALLAWNALKRSRSAFRRNGAKYVFSSLAGIILVGALFEWRFEQGTKQGNIHSYLDAIWWAATTVTTVGYGDLYPTTTGGRAIAGILMVVGIGLVGYISATLASYFVQEDNKGSQNELERIVLQLASTQQQLEKLLALVEGQSQKNENQDSLEPENLARKHLPN